MADMPAPSWPGKVGPRAGAAVLDDAHARGFGPALGVRVGLLVVVAAGQRWLPPGRLVAPLAGALGVCSPGARAAILAVLIDPEPRASLVGLELPPSSPTRRRARR